MKCLENSSFKLIKVIFIYISLGLFIVYTNAQIPNGENKRLTGSIRLNERIYLHLDKELYLSGESIWFKAYCYDGTLKLPINLSSVAYIELYSQDNEPISQEKIALKNGQGFGNIPIPKISTTDYYYIRAYTNYMKNFGPETFYLQRIKVINPFLQINEDKSHDLSMKDIEIALFPEHKDLITGISNKIVYMCSPMHNSRQEVSAYLKNDNDSIVTNINIDDRGIGYFSFIPNLNNTYKLHVMSNGEEIVKELPLPRIEGLSLAIEQMTNDTMFISIISKNNDVLFHSLTAYQMGLKIRINQEYFKNENELAIPIKDLPSGIITLKLEDRAQNPLCERMIYIPQHNDLKIQVSSNKPVYGTREKVDIGIETFKNGQASKQTNLSLFVSFLIDSTDFDKPQYFYKYILKNELRGILGNVDEDFLDYLLNDEHLLNCALLMAMKPVESNNTFLTGERTMNYYPEVNGDIISGTLSLEYRKNGVHGITLYQSFIDSICWLEVTKTDSLGRFHFAVSPKPDQSVLTIGVNDTVKKYKMMLDDEFFPEFLDIEKKVYLPGKDLKASLQKAKINVQITDAFEEHRQEIQNMEKFSFYGTPTSIYYFDDYIKLPIIEEFIFEVVEGAKIQKRRGSSKLKVKDTETGLAFRQEPLILLDGVPYFNHDAIIKSKPEKYKSIALIENKYFYKDAVFSGIIDIKTKTGDFSLFNIPENTFLFDFVEVQYNKYNNSSENLSLENINNRIPEYRNLLFSEPFIETDKNGRITVSFYTGDNTGIYIIDIQGQDKYGHTGYYRTLFKIE